MIKRWLIRIFGVCLVLFVALIGLLYWKVNTQPGGPRLPLDSRLVGLHTPKGQKWLKESRYRSDYARLKQHLATQIRGAYCGVASSVTVLKAISVGNKAGLTQRGFFDENASKVISSFWVTLRGMTLQELTGLLQAHGAKAQRVHAKGASLQTFRDVMKRELRAPHSALLANYSRTALGQKGVGHISPIAAYHEKSDHLLVMDVATYKYPPTWVPTALFWRAMQTIDRSVKESRGYVLVQR